MTTLIRTPFGFESTAAEVAAGIDLSGKRAIVTGASSGIGVETARVLAAAGAEVTLAVRNPAAAPELDGATRVESLDLADRASVAAFAERWSGPLHLLVNNAGVMALPERTLSAAGWELQLETNHLGHFALARGLHGALAEAGGARIVALSSRGHLRSPVVFEDLHFARRAYDPWLAYGQSKTANVLFAVEATRRWAEAGIFANAVHPGGIETNLARHLPEDYIANARAANQIRFKTVEQGAATTMVAAVSPLLEGVGGRYLEDCNEAEPVADPGPNTTGGVATYAIDAGNAERLWELSGRELG